MCSIRGPPCSLPVLWIPPNPFSSSSCPCSAHQSHTHTHTHTHTRKGSGGGVRPRNPRLARLLRCCRMCSLDRMCSRYSCARCEYLSPFLCMHVHMHMCMHMYIYHKYIIYLNNCPVSQHLQIPSTGRWIQDRLRTAAAAHTELLTIPTAADHEIHLSGDFSLFPPPSLSLSLSLSPSLTHTHTHRERETQRLEYACASVKRGLY